MAQEAKSPEAETVAEVLSVQAAEGLSNRQVARILDCSPAVWSQIRAGKYAGDAAKYLARAAQWLRERRERRGGAESDYVETSIGRAIMAVCARAWQLPCIGRIVTESGAGKTAALAEFARRRGNKALYLAVGELVADKRGLLADLAERLAVGLPRRPTAYDRASAVRRRFADSYAGGKGTPFLVLVDEATVLAPSAINLLRNFHDDPACRVGVVLADTARLDAYLRSPSGIAGGNEQLRSRCGAAYAHTKGEEIALSDVKAVAGSVLAGIGFDPKRLGAEDWKFLHRLAQKDGRLRNVVYRLTAVRDVAEAAGARPSYSARELDFAATLVGERCELDHREPPFVILHRAGRSGAGRAAVA